ncbi:MAG: TatD family hydrolase [Salinivirgaceae bacterium]|nr:TatD family hydrolase [Salinivirgaceae bacterium]
MHPFIDIHTHKQKTGGSIEILNVEIKKDDANRRNISMGIHPWNINDKNYGIHLLTIKNQLSHFKLQALGEIGIDRAISISLDAQKQVFIEQVQLSESFNIPIIIHCVRAYSDILEIRNNVKAKQAWIFHGYNGSIQMAHQIINHNCYLSFGEYLLKNTKIQAVFSKVPLNNIFLETDDAQLTIDVIYQKAAQLKGLNIESLKEIIYNNYIQIFNENTH